MPNRLFWDGVVYFGDFANATGHVDPWNGSKAVHTTYKDHSPTCFWKLVP